MTSLDHRDGQIRLTQSLTRSVLPGEILVRDPADQFAGILPTALTDRVVGVVDDVHGGDPGQIPALRIFRAGQRRVRIRDGEAVPAGSDLMPSIVDPGSAELNVGGTVFATSLEATSGAPAPQFAMCDVLADSIGAGPAIPPASVALNVDTPDITTASIVYVEVPLSGTLSRASLALHTATLAINTFTYRLNGILLAGGGNAVPTPSSAGDGVGQARTNPVSVGDVIGVDGDGAAVAGGVVTHTLLIEA